jgi:TolB-like protein/Tfp pilus assembly protein PilF/predicted Ser/Thr protein kinase
MLGNFGDYELLEEIGRGGQGVVYRAQQKSLNRTVAVKIIGLGPWTTDEHIKRFRREAEAAAKLDHAFIVPIHEIGERDGWCYFSMNFIEGGQLDKVVKRTPISIRQSAELIAKVARTVHYAHEHGILHRDIKPGNILLDTKGDPHLTDFGLARLVEAESTITRTLEVMGTPSYMAPEQATGEHTKISKATDVYGLGAVLYQLLTGHPPFTGGTSYETIRLLLDTEPRRPRLWNRKIDRELSTICLKCLEKDPKRRYPSALALAEDLEHWLKHEPIQAKPSGVFTRSRKWVRRNPSTALSITLLVAFAMGLGLMVLNRKPPVLIPKSVAVLPFENLSDEKESAYFADGIQEEILTRLASVADLKVISRTSTQHYHSKPGNLAEIAKQLGVANILEGSVQKAADRVRVNVQLVNALTDSHLWADTYDRKLTDIFGVESEIAKAITASLQAKLTGRQEQALAIKPTNNSEAYDAYLRGLAFEARTSTGVEKAIGFFERAVQLDPAFAVAWARLSRANAQVYFGGLDRTTTRRDAAERALNTAQKLQPSSPETLLAQAYYQYWVLRDYELATATFGRVRELLPSSSDVPGALAVIARRQGHWDESVAYWEQTLALDPRSTEWLANAADTYAMLRQFPAALKTYDRLLDIVPNDPDTIASEAKIYQAEGNLEQAGKLLAGVNAQTPSFIAFLTKMNQLFLERHFDEAIRWIHSRRTESRDLSDIERFFNPYFLFLAQENAGDIVGARATAQQMLGPLETVSQKDPDNPNFAQVLSLIHAVLGEKDAAIKEAGRAITLLPSAKDAVDGPTAEENLAFVEVLVGDKDSAIPRLQHLLQIPYNNCLTPALLRLNPQWDALRSDPAFQKLCEEKLDKSIAVLPFENLSNNADNTYFAEGIQEEILTRLVKIGDLKVISRSSTQKYKSAPDNLPEVGKQLGVAHVLEGSVQKVANTVHVNVQLIRAETDEHLWAESYNRKLDDVFGVEGEVASAVADQLNAKLSGAEQKAVVEKPTQNAAAYDAYLHAVAVDNAQTLETTKRVADLYADAVRLDPQFALSWARLAIARSQLYFNGIDLETNSGAAVKDAADRAMSLQLELGEAWLAQGVYRYRVLRDFQGALQSYEEALRRLPNSAFVLEQMAHLERRLGHVDVAQKNYQAAAQLDPRNIGILLNLADTLQSVRRFYEARTVIDRVLEMSPENEAALAAKAQSFQSQGRLNEAAEVLAKAPANSQDLALTVVEALQLYYERRFDAAIAQIQQHMPAAIANDPRVLTLLGHSQKLGGHEDGARATFARAAAALKPTPSSVVVVDARLLPCYLSQAYAGIGEKEKALEQARHAISDYDSDAIAKPFAEIILAILEAQIGDIDSAIGALPHLLEVPNGATRGGLRIDPLWDPLRNDPRFQKLCEEKQP